MDLTDIPKELFSSIDDNEKEKDINSPKLAVIVDNLTKICFC